MVALIIQQGIGEQYDTLEFFTIGQQYGTLNLALIYLSNTQDYINSIKIDAWNPLSYTVGELGYRSNAGTDTGKSGTTLGVSIVLHGSRNPEVFSILFQNWIPGLIIGFLSATASIVSVLFLLKSY